MGDTSTTQAVRPLEGDPGSMAEELRAYAREGIGHVQLVLDPITAAVDRGIRTGPRDARRGLMAHARIARLVLLSGGRFVRRPC